MAALLRSYYLLPQIRVQQFFGLCLETTMQLSLLHCGLCVCLCALLWGTHPPSSVLCCRWAAGSPRCKQRRKWTPDDLGNRFHLQFLFGQSCANDKNPHNCLVSWQRVIKLSSKYEKIKKNHSQFMGDFWIIKYARIIWEIWTHVCRALHLVDINARFSDRGLVSTTFWEVLWGGDGWAAPAASHVRNKVWKSEYGNKWGCGGKT